MELKDRENAQLEVDLISGPQSRRALAALLNHSFQVPEDHAFLGDFPIWDESIVPSSEETVRIGAFSSGRQELAACAGVRMARLKTPSGGLPVALIGAVATHETYRGAGLASGLVSLATEWAGARGASAVFLWGSEYSLYNRLGFELCGAQVMVPLDSLELSETEANSVQTGWDRSIFQRMKSREGGLALADTDERWMAAHRSVEWFWVGDGQNCDAYVAVGRGIDLQGIVHEWGGEPAALRSLLGWLRKQRSGLTLLGAPWILERFGFRAQQAQPEFLCLARVLQPELLVKAFYPNSDFSAHAQGSGFLVTSEQGSLQLDSAQIARLVLGPHLESASQETRQGGKRQLTVPIPLWIWGLDAV
ncbi:MAG: GNAT family N-acetyltransferase [Bdellovibrionia bacterium]